jgi:hypothetical protein
MEPILQCFRSDLGRMLSTVDCLLFPGRLDLLRGQTLHYDRVIINIRQSIVSSRYVLQPGLCVWLARRELTLPFAVLAYFLPQSLARLKAESAAYGPKNNNDDDDGALFCYPIFILLQQIYCHSSNTDSTATLKCCMMMHEFNERKCVNGLMWARNVRRRLSRSYWRSDCTVHWQNGKARWEEKKVPGTG